MSYFKAKTNQIRFRMSSTPDPAGAVYIASADPSPFSATVAEFGDYIVASVDRALLMSHKARTGCRRNVN